MDLARCVETLNVLGDESRLRLCALLRERELRVTDLVRVTGISQSGVSTHLARLRDAGFVRDRRDGSQSFYALALEGLPRSALAALDEATSSSDPTLEGDQRRLVELDEERRGGAPESFTGDMERHYSPGRTWQSLAMGVVGMLRLGDVLDVGSGGGGRRGRRWPSLALGVVGMLRVGVVLEVGSADGADAGLIAPYCRSLTCIDTAEKMIEAARERLARYPHVRTETADVHDLPYRASAFDTVLVFHTLAYAERPARALEECARVLRPGGRLVALSLDEHRQTAVTGPYGERHAGFSPRTLRAMLSRAGLGVATAAVACREAKKPFFQVVVAIADKPKHAPSKGERTS